MTKNEFVDEIARLRDVYGEKAFPEERISLIWREMKTMHVTDFHELVSELIGTSATAPLLGKFREAKSELARRQDPRRLNELRAWVDRQPDCSMCRKSGNVLATEKKSGDTFAFVCRCHLGERIGGSGPRWDDRLREHFEPEFDTDHFPAAKFLRAKLDRNPDAMKQLVNNAVRGMPNPDPNS